MPFDGILPTGELSSQLELILSNSLSTKFVSCLLSFVVISTVSTASLPGGDSISTPTSLDSVQSSKHSLFPAGMCCHRHAICKKQNKNLISMKLNKVRHAYVLRVTSTVLFLSLDRCFLPQWAPCLSHFILTWTLRVMSWVIVLQMGLSGSEKQRTNVQTSAQSQGQNLLNIPSLHLSWARKTDSSPSLSRCWLSVF